MAEIAIRKTRLPSGEAVPALGHGTWHMGEDPARRKDEVAALRLGLDLGMTLVDTAEMYGDGEAEKVVREAIHGRRDEVFLVTKVLPHHATKRGTIAACEGSLRRLGTDQIDLYLLHWRGEVPLDETIDGFTALLAHHKIRHWGVSNFDVADLKDLIALPGGSSASTDQVLYNLTRRGIEWDLLPRCRSLDVPIMAYSPIEQGRLVHHPELARIARRRGATPAQVALAWVLRNEDMMAIPKASSPAHVRENRGALDLQLTEEDLAALDRAFPPPSSKVPLEVL